MKHQFFPFVWNSDVTPSTQALSDSHQWVLEKHECTTRHFSNSCNTGTSFCRFVPKYTEAFQSPRIVALQPPEMLSAVFGPSISNEQRRLFLFRLDPNDVPVS